MIHVEPRQPDAVYERELDASVERIWENVLDWEHLPYLHSQAFSSVSMSSGDADGWRGEVGLAGAPGSLAAIDVALDRANLRYMNRTVSGIGAGTEILTHLFPKAPHRTAIRVEFTFPWAPRDAVAGIGDVYRSLYEGLWDQDEEMMIARQRVVDGARNRANDRAAGTVSPDSVSLGSMRDLAARLPLDVTLAGRPLRVVQADGRVLAFDTRCPHLGGPLQQQGVGSCELVCPWHGYRFDAATGASCDGRSLRLVPGPVVQVDACSGEVTLALR